MVLLIVLLILMMTTATATYAVHSTAYEIQAAGGMRQALRTRNVSEGMASAMMLRASEPLTRLCAEAGAVQDQLGASFTVNVEKYGFPAIEPSESGETIGSFRLDSLSTSGLFENTPIPDDSALASASTAATYVPNAWALVECKEVSAFAGDELGSANKTTRSFHRVRLTVFGEMSSALDDPSNGNPRGDHETVSISRVYLNTSE